MHRREVIKRPALQAGDVHALRAARHEIGFHTLHHHRLDRLDDRGLADAMTEGRENLECLMGRRLRLIAYPHGRADRRVAAAAAHAGFELGFTGVPQPVRLDEDLHLIGGIEPAFGTVDRFALQLAQTLGRSPA